LFLVRSALRDEAISTDRALSGPRLLRCRNDDWTERCNLIGICARGEVTLAAVMIEARTCAGFTQQQLAERKHTMQAVIAGLESGRVKPSTRTLERLAAATGLRLRTFLRVGYPRTEHPVSSLLWPSADPLAYCGSQRSVDTRNAAGSGGMTARSLCGVSGGAQS
jgi:transcriptional regulator with XRE-family HTH domain